ncbi:MAG: hypothetical protein ACYTEL_00930 [Planctomycetota bacterium]|jgi:hypothetical protein
MFEDRQFRLVRIWSNKEIRRLAPLFGGDIVNISGWDDRDKEGDFYRNYFTAAASYTITNYSGERGLMNREHEIFLDLTEDLREDLINRFDVCFNHTTLEHIFDVLKGFSTICRMSRDVVFVVVPFCQAEHETESFKDFWRFTPSCLHCLFKENGLEIVYEACSPYSNAGIYLLFVGSKNPERWKVILPEFEATRDVGDWIGQGVVRRVVNVFVKKARVVWQGREK